MSERTAALILFCSRVFISLLLGITGTTIKLALWWFTIVFIAILLTT